MQEQAEIGLYSAKMDSITVKATMNSNKCSVSAVAGPRHHSKLMTTCWHHHRHFWEVLTMAQMCKEVTTCQRRREPHQPSVLAWAVAVTCSLTRMMTKILRWCLEGRRKRNTSRMLILRQVTILSTVHMFCLYVSNNAFYSLQLIEQYAQRK